MKSKRFSSRTLSKGTSYFKGAWASQVESASTKDKGKEKFAKPYKDIQKNLMLTQGNALSDGYGHFQSDCHNQRVMTLQVIEEVDMALQEAKNNLDQNGFEFGKEEETMEKAK